MKKLCNRKWISVEEIFNIETSWGWDYKLYKDFKDDPIYYVQECDDEKNIMEFGKFTSDDEAIEEFKNYMEELEKDVKEN